MISSSTHGEGKTTVLANLGASLAQTGAAVILVDCDLRKPDLHRLFDLPNERGLTSLILTQEGVKPYLQRNEKTGLDVLTSGPLPPNPAEILGSKRMEGIIRELRDAADYVLFDVPPILSVTDAAVLARKVDGTILVLSAGKAKRDDAKRAKRTLEELSSHFLGVVVNNIKLDRNGGRLYGG
jgi:non-specific protein-tyrosine kinase